ncbi:MAG: peptidylprolyl isomerase [Elusimicrobia bacterium]|nr:peptidylprolyl isomerase [Elusimicrobiota bacterium]
MNQKRFGYSCFVFVITILLLNNNLRAAGKVKIRDGMMVSLNYTLTANDKILESTVGKTPFTYVHGAKQLLPSLEKELNGLKVGNKKKVKLLPKDAYGPINSKAVEIVPLNAFKDTKSLKIGGMITHQGKGRTVRATIKAIDDESVILDYNHPLAGKTLIYEIEVLEVKPSKKG